MLTFQQIVLKLQEYWDRQGCALLQPYDMEVGAGTSHTATFLRSLGPEPWRAAIERPYHASLVTLTSSVDARAAASSSAPKTSS